MSAHESMRERSKQRQAAEAGVAARGRRRPPALAPLLLLLPLLILPAAQAEWTEAAPVALQQAQLLPPAAYRPVAWSVEEVGAMRRALLPPAAYRPVAWSAEEVAGMRRALLQRTATASGTLQLPICELDLSYRIVDLLAENFTAILTLTNNREVCAARRLPLVPLPAPLSPPVPVPAPANARPAPLALPPARRSWT